MATKPYNFPQETPPPPFSPENLAGSNGAAAIPAEQKKLTAIEREQLAGEISAYREGLVRFFRWKYPTLSAVDFAQETIARALENANQFKGTSGLKPWVFTIGKNIAVDFLRSEDTKPMGNLQAPKEESQQTLLDFLPGDTDPESRLIRNLDMQRYRKAVMEMVKDSAEKETTRKYWLEIFDMRMAGFKDEEIVTKLESLYPEAIIYEATIRADWFKIKELLKEKFNPPK